MNKKMVIDLSSYNAVTNYEAMKQDGVDAVILKVIRKDLNPDNGFERHYAGCLKAKIPVIGVYNYSYAKTEAKAKLDAQAVLKVLNGRKVKVWLDVEDNCQKNLGITLVNIINAYQKIIEAAGLEFGVYTGLSFYDSYLKRYANLIRCNFWIARYPSSSTTTTKTVPVQNKKPSVRHPLEGWQFSSNGSVKGIKGSVDMNEWYGSIVGQNTPTTFIPPTAAGNKLDYSPVFNASYYFNKYPDLQKAFKAVDDNLLFNHFLTFGMNEGRQGSAEFNVSVYKDRYVDLRNTFGDCLPLYYQHYVQFGKAEKRSAI